MPDEIDELRGRIAELERRVAVLFHQTGSSDWEAEAKAAPAVSDEVRLLLEAGEQKRAVEPYMRETGAGVGAAAAALGELAKQLSADRPESG